MFIDATENNLRLVENLICHPRQDGVNSGGKAGVVSHGGTHRKSVGEILGPLGSISFQDININECESALSLEATKSLDDTIQLNEDLAIIAEASLGNFYRLSPFSTIFSS
jgi:hypothetical protein